MMNKTHWANEAKAWIKRGEIVRVVPDIVSESKVKSYELFTAFDKDPDYLGRILFDPQGYWIYDGDILTVTEQEQLAKFITNYVGGI